MYCCMLVLYVCRGLLPAFCVYSMHILVFKVNVLRQQYRIDQFQLFTYQESRAWLAGYANDIKHCLLRAFYDVCVTPICVISIEVNQYQLVARDFSIILKNTSFQI